MNVLSKTFEWIFILFRCIPRLYRHSFIYQRLPRPRGYPIIGNLLDLISIPQNLCSLRTTYQPACRVQFLDKKIVFLNSLKAINSVFIEQGDYTSDRPRYFFQKYVFENKGFGFDNYDARVAKQKLIFMHFFQRQDSEEIPDNLFNDIDRLITAFKLSSEADVDTNILKPFLTDYFTKQQLRIEERKFSKLKSEEMFLMKLIFQLLLIFRKTSDDVLKAIAQIFKSKTRHLPGPLGLPFIGSYFQFDSNKTQHLFTEWGKEFGQILKFSLLGKNIDLVRKTLEKGALSFHMNDRPCNTTKYVFQDRKHVGFADLNSNTIKLRDILKVDLQNLSQEESCENNLRITIDRLTINLLTNIDKDLDPDIYIKHFLTSFYSTLLIGETFPESDPDYNVLWEFIDLLYTLLEPSFDGPLRAFPFLRFFPGKYGRIFRETIKARDRVAKRYFESHKAAYRDGITRGLVDVCLKKQADDIRKTGSSWLTDDYIKGLMYDTLAAGMTEMMKTLRLLILLMCHHQDCQRRVQQEIDDVIGQLDKPSASHRNDMPYTEAVIMEMMRYVSQTPLAIPHKCNKDVILDGYLIEKDSGIFPNLWGIHHDETVWGDPWEFRPERFLDNDNKLLPSDHELMHSFIPFSVGKRRCPGQNFAMSRTFVIFTSLLQQIHFLPPNEEELPSADPRLYTTKYPLYLPLFKCKAVQRTS